MVVVPSDAAPVAVVEFEAGAVVIPGAFRGAWAVAPVVESLVARGLCAEAARLTGMDPPATPAARRSGELVTLSCWVGDVVEGIRAMAVDRVVLVGHSQGGMVAAAVAEAAPDLVSGIAFLDAPIPLAGQRGVDLGGAVPRALPEAATWMDPPEVAASSWLGDDLAEFVNARVAPSPLAPSLTPIVAAAVRTTWVAAFCAGTPAGYPSTVTRARLTGEGTPYAVLDAGHEVPLSAPQLVVDWLLDSWELLQGDVGS